MGIEGEVGVFWALWVDLGYDSDFALPPWRKAVGQSRLNLRKVSRLYFEAMAISYVVVEKKDQLRGTKAHPRRRVVESSLGVQSVS
jgi:hypothetical protein